MSSPNLSHRCLKEAKPTKLNTFFGFSSFPKTCKPESAKENLDSRLEHFPAAAPLLSGPDLRKDEDVGASARWLGDARRTAGGASCRLQVRPAPPPCSLQALKARQRFVARLVSRRMFRRRKAMAAPRRMRRSHPSPRQCRFSATPLTCTRLPLPAAVPPPRRCFAALVCSRSLIRRGFHRPHAPPCPRSASPRRPGSFREKLQRDSKDDLTRSQSRHAAAGLLAGLALALAPVSPAHGSPSPVSFATSRSPASEAPSITSSNSCTGSHWSEILLATTEDTFPGFTELPPCLPWTKGACLAINGPCFADEASGCGSASKACFANPENTDCIKGMACLAKCGSDTTCSTGPPPSCCYAPACPPERQERSTDCDEPKPTGCFAAFGSGTLPKCPHVVHSSTLANDQLCSTLPPKTLASRCNLTHTTLLVQPEGPV